MRSNRSLASPSMHRLSDDVLSLIHLFTRNQDQSSVPFQAIRIFVRLSVGEHCPENSNQQLICAALGTLNPSVWHKSAHLGNLSSPQECCEIAAYHNRVTTLQRLARTYSSRIDWARKDNLIFRMAVSLEHLAIVQFLASLPRALGVDPAADANFSIVCASENGHLAMVQFLASLPRERGVTQQQFTTLRSDKPPETVTFPLFSSWHP